MVITQWEWGDGVSYAHDEIATDKRNPTLNANGPIYAVDLGNDRLLTLDPINHRASDYKVPTLNGFSTPWCEQAPRRANGETGRGLGSLGGPAEGGLMGGLYRPELELTRSTRQTLAPWRARQTATPWPIEPTAPPPVTSAFVPERENICPAQVSPLKDA